MRKNKVLDKNILILAIVLGFLLILFMGCDTEEPPETPTENGSEINGSDENDVDDEDDGDEDDTEDQTGNGERDADDEDDGDEDDTEDQTGNGESDADDGDDGDDQNGTDENDIDDEDDTDDQKDNDENDVDDKDDADDQKDTDKDEDDAKDSDEEESTTVAEELGISEVSYIRYTTTALNIRADAHIDGERIGVFPEGAEVHVIGEVPNNWVQVEYEGSTAFVHGGYLQESDPAETTSVAEELGVSEVSYTRYTTTALNIRADAHIDGERIGGFPEGAEVHVIGEVPNNWVQVEYGDTDAFVHGGYLTGTDPTDESSDDDSDRDAPGDEDSDPDVPGDEDSSIVVSNPSAIDVLINRTYRLPADFTPPNLVEPGVRISPTANNRLLRSVAATALESMFDGAEADGVILYAQSGYRSYSTQEYLFNSYVDNHGYEAASRFTAKPGHSEHQTGLAMDVTSENVNYRLTQDFGNTQEGQWVAANAHRYGFIIRYPQNKEAVTGYMYEPWHLRYLGVDLATAVYESGLTYEEYLGY